MIPVLYGTAPPRYFLYSPKSGALPHATIHCQMNRILLLLLLNQMESNVEDKLPI